MYWHHSQSVWQAPDPSLGQKRVSAFFLPTWSCWGSGSSARQVYLNLCSCLDPPWLTLNGIQGVQGVLRRTSGQASRLQALYSCKTERRHVTFHHLKPLSELRHRVLLFAQSLRISLSETNLWICAFCYSLWRRLTVFYEMLKLLGKAVRRQRSEQQ